MTREDNRIFFALLRSAICGEPPQGGMEALTAETTAALLEMAHRQDLSNLIVLGLEENGLLPADGADLRRQKLKAVFRCEQLQYELERLCAVLETAEIPFIPLKGAVMRQYYREAWMRTSCDVDVLIHREDLKRATAALERELQYRQTDSTPHDISLYSPNGTHIELHFDLVEEGRANRAAELLSCVWEYALPCAEGGYHHVLEDAFFYFYHVAHMAKHFEGGGCGIRPFLDLWILDRMEGADRERRASLLQAGGLDVFAAAARDLCGVWLEGCEADERTLNMEAYLLDGGVYGTTENRVAAQQHKKGGRLRYLLSRFFLPYPLLKAQYPILDRHGWLAPFVCLRRWCRLLRPDVARRARQEVGVGTALSDARANEVASLMQSVGLSS